MMTDVWKFIDDGGIIAYGLYKNNRLIAFFKEKGKVFLYEIPKLI